MAGGALAARLQLTHFLKVGLEQYPEARKHPVCDNTSRLSAYLHFGHLGAHDVVAELLESSGWSIDQVSPKTNGRKAGWWGLSEAAELFLDQVITWRELGYGFCNQRLEDYDTYEGLPEWARETLDEHAADDRPVQYSFSELECASTEDPLWNAAQRQLVLEGRIHGYLRMLWGKRILEWCSHPRVALEWMITLNNRYALDGRNPNSYSGIQWTLGRFDRPWGPVRPIYGKVRYMSSARTYQKMDTAPYLERYGPDRDLEEPGTNLQRYVAMGRPVAATHGK